MQRFSSQVLTQTAKAADSDRFEVVPIEAADAMSAARRIADIAARRRYQENGSVGYVSPGADEGFFLAAIGVQYPCETGITLKGVTILIHVWPTD
jgi:hypothetical protein